MFDDDVFHRGIGVGFGCREGRVLGDGGAGEFQHIVDHDVSAHWQDGESGPVMH